MPIRTAKAAWKDTLKKGKGALELGSGAYKGEYSWTLTTNPQELIGAERQASPWDR